MFGSSLFSSRIEKELVLKEIISKLSISDSEKEIYILSLEILSDTDFDQFYKNITKQFSGKIHNEHLSIEPLTTTLI